MDCDPFTSATSPGSKSSCNTFPASIEFVHS